MFRISEVNLNRNGKNCDVERAGLFARTISVERSDRCLLRDIAAVLERRTAAGQAEDLIRDLPKTKALDQYTMTFGRMLREC